jgi:hypothetical protein
VGEFSGELSSAVQHWHPVVLGAACPLQGGHNPEKTAYAEYLCSEEDINPVFPTVSLF